MQPALLEGWDFTLTFRRVPPDMLAGFRLARTTGLPPEAGGAASDPVGGTSLFDAVEKARPETRGPEAPVSSFRH